jgi:hypothetical protein
MSDWAADEHKTAGGQSHFAQFVAGLTDAKDIKDAAVLISALRALGNQLREPRPNRSTKVCSSFVARACEYISGSCRRGALYWSAAT